jgi:hypothetical protein
MSTRAVPAPAERDTRRWIVAAVLAVLLLVAVVVGDGDDDAGGAPPRRDPTDTAAMAEPSARSTAWYCPGPPPSPLLGDARERVVVTNLEDEPVDVSVSYVNADGRTAQRTVDAPARSIAFVEVEEQSPEQRALVVEPFASNVAVETTSTGPDTLASTPCATQPSTEWHFASGTTVRGAEDWIVLFNPFGDDAVVELSFFTGSGFEQPDGLQGVTVPRRSRLAVPVHLSVRREVSVAATITARTGRIVAQRTLLFGENTGRSGVTRSLGAVTTAAEWVFPSGSTAPGSNRTIAISNPGDLDGEVDVAVAPATDVVVEPATVAVPRRGVANVQIGLCEDLQPPACIPVPQGVAYNVVVRATLDVPVVAESFMTWTRGRYTGAAAEVGSHAPARAWVFARSRVSDEIGASLDLLTTGTEVAYASVTYVVGGRSVAPSRLQRVELRPGVRVSIPLVTQPELEGVDAAIVVRADRPIVAERTLVRADEVTRALGIPSR